MMEHNISNCVNNDTEEAVAAQVTKTDFNVMDTNAITTVEKKISSHDGYQHEEPVVMPPQLNSSVTGVVVDINGQPPAQRSD